MNMNKLELRINNLLEVYDTVKEESERQRALDSIEELLSKINNNEIKIITKGIKDGK